MGKILGRMCINAAAAIHTYCQNVRMETSSHLRFRPILLAKQLAQFGLGAAVHRDHEPIGKRVVRRVGRDTMFKAREVA